LRAGSNIRSQAAARLKTNTNRTALRLMLHSSVFLVLHLAQQEPELTAVIFSGIISQVN
jgi:hypothetical protein